MLVWNSNEIEESWRVQLSEQIRNACFKGFFLCSCFSRSNSMDCVIINDFCNWLKCWDLFGDVRETVAAALCISIVLMLSKACAEILIQKSANFHLSSERNHFAYVCVCVCVYCAHSVYAFMNKNVERIALFVFVCRFWVRIRTTTDAWIKFTWLWHGRMSFYLYIFPYKFLQLCGTFLFLFGLAF